MMDELYWDRNRNLYAVTPDRKEYSQFANALAVLAGMVQGQTAEDLVNRILQDSSLVQCTYYSRFYLHSAMNRVEAGDRYLDIPGEWGAMLARGLTTWAETPEDAEHTSRSDCHAWSAHPNFELFRTVLGIDSAAPGFSKVTVRPSLCRVNDVFGTIPHPKSEVSVRLARPHGRLTAEIVLPPGVTGVFEWQGTRRPLPSGKTRLEF